jgi:hypothetical protein
MSVSACGSLGGRDRAADLAVSSVGRRFDQGQQPLGRVAFDGELVD